MSKKIKLLVFSTIALGFFLRLHRLPELFHFTYDEEVIAFVGKRISVNKHLPLIGGVTPFHVHLAPYFYWLSGIILFISGLNPLGWGVATAFLAGFTMIILFYLGKEFFNHKVALIALLLYAVSFYQNIFDRHYWGLAFNGIISLIVLLSTYKIIKGKENFLFLSAFVLGFGFHTDPSTLVVLMSFIVSLLYFKPKIRPSKIKLSLAIFFISFIPLILFDFRHDFANSRGIFQYINELQNNSDSFNQLSAKDTLLFIPRTISRLLYSFGDTDLAELYSYCRHHAINRVNNVPLIALLGVIIGFAFFVLKTKEKIPQKLITISFTVAFLGIVVYGIIFKGTLFDHYLSTLFPLFFIIIAKVLYDLFRSFRLIVIALLFLFISANISLLAKAEHRYGYLDKIKAIQWVGKEIKESFSFDVIGSCFRYNGYRYLFYVFGKEPVKSYLDVNFTHLYDQPPDREHPLILVIFANPDFQENYEYNQQYQEYKKHSFKSEKFGNIEIMLIKDYVEKINVDF